MKSISMAFLMGFICLVIVVACVPKKYVPKTWSATGGSRADAVVRLSYEHADHEIPQLNANQALELAVNRCKTWGYTGAEPFGGETRNCNNWTVAFGGGLTCQQWLVTKEYQCTGKGSEN